MFCIVAIIGFLIVFRLFICDVAMFFFWEIRNCILRKEKGKTEAWWEHFHTLFCSFLFFIEILFYVLWDKLSLLTLSISLAASRNMILSSILPWYLVWTYIIHVMRLHMLMIFCCRLRNWGHYFSQLLYFLNQHPHMMLITGPHPHLVLITGPLLLLF